MKTSSKTYAATQEELAIAIGISRQEWSSKWSKRLGLPAKTAKGWDVQAVIEWKAKWERDQALKITGPYADLKRRKLAADAETSEVKLAAMKGELVAFHDMLGYLQQLGQIQRDAFAQAVAMVKVRTGSVEMVKIMEQVRDDTFKAIRDAVDKIA